MDSPNTKNVFNNSKVLDSLKPLFLLQLMFGYDYGLYRHKGLIIRFIIKSLCTLIIFVLPGLVIYLEFVSGDFDIMIIFPVQYFIEALTIVYVYGPRIINNLNKYNDIDEKLKIRDKDYKKFKWYNIIYVLALLLLSLAYTSSLSTERDKGLKASSFFLFILDISFALRLNFLSVILYRVKLLRKCIEKQHTTRVLVDEKSSSNKMPIISPKLYVPLYKDLADQLDDINKCIGFPFMFSFFISLLKFLYLIRDISFATTPDFEIDIYFLIMSSSLAIHTVVFLGSPGLLGEMILIEARKIKLFFANELLAKSDTENIKNINVFLEYISIRPLSLIIWGVLPLNLALFNSVISLCLTVFIFIMQFNQVPNQKNIE